MTDRTLGLALGLLITAAAQVSAQPADILREAVGARAADLAKLELKPFDSALWSTLSDWTNGPALDPGATGGRVVLIMTWASWNPASTRMLAQIQSLKDKYEGEGLLVVGVHHPQGWETAAETLTKRRADFLIAQDATGAFREGLKIDQDPDFYVIDRAGQLRFADIRNESVEDAVKQLLAEDVSAAGGIRSRLEEEARRREAEFARPKTIQAGVDLSTLPEVPFAAPSEQAYQLTPWPERKRDDNSGRNDQDAGPRALPLPAAGWLGDTPPKTSGRVVAYYGWQLDDPRATTIVRDMDLLQRQLGRDVVLVGVLTGVHQPNNNSGRTDQVIDPASILPRVNRMRRTYGITHPMLIDLGGQMFTADGSSGNDKGYQVYVVSSDSIMRWDGLVSDPAFRAALDRVTNVDPGVRARRAAEQTYIRANGG